MNAITAANIGSKAVLKGIKNFLPNRILIRRGPADRKQIALTFDDGPHAEITPLVLEILEQHSVPATFFLIGSRAAAHPQLVRRMIEDGHEVGNHSQTHGVLTELSREAGIREIESGEDTLKSITNRPINLFRPPKGELSLGALWRLAEKKTTTVLWSVDPKDFLMDSPECLWDKLKDEPLQGGDIVLLHDRLQAVVDVLPRLIERIRALDLRLTTVGGMLQ